MSVTPADLVADCLAGGVRRLIGGVHSLTSSRAVVVCADEQWVAVRFSASPGPLPTPWETDAAGWVRAPRGSEPGLRDASADPVLVVVGVAESQVVAVNALAIDEIGVTCSGRESLIANWLLQAQVQGAAGDESAVAGARLSANPDATVVVADPLVDGHSGWVDVLAAGTSWPVRPLKTPIGEALRESTGSPTACGDGLAEQDADAAPVDGDARSGAADCGARLRVFGRFEVTDAAGEQLQPMQQQIVGVIRFDGPIPTARLCQVLYGAERHKSFHVAMSKMRRRGLNPVLTDAGYRIDIDSDWRRFTKLVGVDPSGADTAALIEAVEMVAVPLFGAQPPSWAVPHLPGMRDLICRACRELAARHADDPGAALRYANVGLEVDPQDEELVTIANTINGIAGE
ncbi:hypothetical protein [Mycobacterium kyorinense]|uniref:Uncharacterized protein n=1 Tax=Mycobacterium kyorinense TaxID=487514 RepID=A0A1X1Y1Q6_9MYCO|nr:hypothetical protein [Mycobacterium kyorinense]ORW05009.1 hypothetical protein AWC14_02060 [Mycobacterium kyorinense]